jgi:hypothetical protein
VRGFATIVAQLRRTMTVIAQFEQFMQQLRANEAAYWKQRADLRQSDWDVLYKDVQHELRVSLVSSENCDLLALCGLPFLPADTPLRSQDLVRQAIVLRAASEFFGPTMFDLVRNHYGRTTTTLSSGQVFYTASTRGQDWRVARSHGDQNRPGVLRNLALVPEHFTLTLNFDVENSSDKLTRGGLRLAVLQASPWYSPSYGSVKSVTICNAFAADVDLAVVTECSLLSSDAGELATELQSQEPGERHPVRVILAGSDYVARSAVMPVVGPEGQVSQVVKNCPSVPAMSSAVDEFAWFDRKHPIELTLFYGTSGRAFTVVICSDLLHKGIITELERFGIDTVFAPCHSHSDKRMVEALERCGVRRRILVNSAYELGASHSRWSIYVDGRNEHEQDQDDLASDVTIVELAA